MFLINLDRLIESQGISKNEFSKGQRGDIIVITVTCQHVFTDIIINGRGRHLPEIRNGRI